MMKGARRSLLEPMSKIIKIRWSSSELVETERHWGRAHWSLLESGVGTHQSSPSNVQTHQSRATLEESSSEFFGANIVDCHRSLEHVGVHWD